MGKSAASCSQTENSDTYWHKPVWLPAVTQATSDRCHETIEQKIQRQHQGSAATAPAKLIQNRREENREGVPGTINQHHANSNNTYDDPAVEK